MRNEVRSLRSAPDLSQQALGHAMGVSRQTINSIEKERYTPSLPLAIALARYFGRPVEEIFHVETDTTHRTTEAAGMTRSRWWMPAFSLFLGALMLAAFGSAAASRRAALVRDHGRARGRVRDRRRRSETISGIGGSGRDERWEMIDLRATAFAGSVLTVIIGAVPYAVAAGSGRQPVVRAGRDHRLAYVVSVALAALALLSATFQVPG